MTKKPQIKGNLAYRTKHGSAYVGDSLAVLRSLPDASVDLVMTSPPYALQRKKSYGNVDTDAYIEWFMPFATEIRRVLKDTGSFVVNIGGVWNKSSPTRSTYHFELAVKLVRDAKYFLAQEFYWHNPARMPAPAEWVTIQRIRVKDSVEMVWWFSKTERPKASNRKVLTPYTKAQLSLFKNGYNHGRRPSGHVVSSKWWKIDNGGAIPPNFMEIPSDDYEDDERLASAIIIAGTEANTVYQRRCKEFDIKPHPARYPAALPEFFVKLLTDEGDLVVDPFAGSNVTGAVCDELKRKWISVDLDLEFVRASAFRFEGKIEKASKEMPEPVTPAPTVTRKKRKSKAVAV